MFWPSITRIIPENINIWVFMIIISVFTDNRLFFQTNLHFVANLDQPRAKFEIWQSCLKHTYLIHFGSEWTKECLKLTTTNKAITCFLNYYSIVSGSDIIAKTSWWKLSDEIFLNFWNLWSNGGSTYVHYIMCIYVNLIYMFISMVIICNLHIF